MQLSIDPLAKHSEDSEVAGSKCEKMPVVFLTENDEVFRKDIHVSDGEIMSIYCGYGYGYGKNDSDVFIGTLDDVI